MSIWNGAAMWNPLWFGSSKGDDLRAASDEKIQSSLPLGDPRVIHELDEVVETYNEGLMLLQEAASEFFVGQKVMLIRNAYSGRFAEIISVFFKNERLAFRVDVHGIGVIEAEASSIEFHD